MSDLMAAALAALAQSFGYGGADVAFAAQIVAEEARTNGSEARLSESMPPPPPDWEEHGASAEGQVDDRGRPMMIYEWSAGSWDEGGAIRVKLHLYADAAPPVSEFYLSEWGDVYDLQPSAMLDGYGAPTMMHSIPEQAFTYIVQAVGPRAILMVSGEGDGGVPDVLRAYFDRWDRSGLSAALAFLDGTGIAPDAGPAERVAAFEAARARGDAVAAGYEATMLELQSRQALQDAVAAALPDLPGWEATELGPDDRHRQLPGIYFSRAYRRGDAPIYHQFAFVNRFKADAATESNDWRHYSSSPYKPVKIRARQGYVDWPESEGEENWMPIIALMLGDALIVTTLGDGHFPGSRDELFAPMLGSDLNALERLVARPAAKRG